MNLRKIRIQLTAMYAVLAALAVGLLAVIALRSGSDSIIEGAEREAEGVVRSLALAGWPTGQEDGRPFNTWRVNVGDEWQWPYGDTWVEPPLFTIAEYAVASGDPVYEEFEQDGSWLAYVQPFEDSSEAVVAVVPLEAFQSDLSAFRLRVVLAALGATVATTLAAWFLAGRALQPARRAMARQRDFIADAAHELRTPLAVIRASSSHALSKDREADAYREALSEVLAATERAGSGVGELLELARLDAGQAEPRKAPLRMDLLLEEVGASVRVDDVAIAVQPSESIVVNADYALLRQVLENLTHNAASRAKNVELSVIRAQDLVTVQVVDDGPGFDEDLLPHVFERFRRGDNRGSTGLGMAIAKSILEAHGGSVSAANRTTGGAIVKLHLAAHDDE